MTTDDRLLAEYVDRVERSWMRLGVAPAQRRRLVLELEADLVTAHAAGAPATELTACDPVAFAVELAQASDATLLVPPHEPTRAVVIKTAIVGAAAGAGAAWIFVETGPVGEVMLGNGAGHRAEYAWIPVQTLALLVTLAGIAGTVWWRFRAAAGARRLAVRTTCLALVGGVVALGPLIGYAWVTDYNTSAYALTLGATLGASIVGGVIRLGTPRRPLRSSV